MAYTTIDKPTDYFNTVTYSGNGSSTQAITGVGHQPDWVWIKSRSHTENHMLSDAVRGSTKRLRSDTTNAEDDLGSNGIQSFNTDGFTAGDGDAMNASGQTYVAWNWKAGGSTSSNSNGDLTSTVSVNTTAGFSICQWTSADTGAVKTVGHGLGVKPDFIIWKGYTRTVDWITFHKSTGKDKNAGWLNTTHASQNANYWGNTEPTSTVFSTEGATEDSGTNIAYCFAEKKGYSKFSSYQGSGNSDGPMIVTGFKPAFVMIKRTDGADQWVIYDNKRTGFNVDNNPIFPNQSDAETTDDDMDILSNGFKIRRNSGRVNTSGGTMIYMAFAESPFVSSTGIPTTAR